MNKKAVLAYIVLLALVAVGSLYIRYKVAGGGGNGSAGPAVQTTVYTATANTVSVNHSAGGPTHLTANSALVVGTGSALRINVSQNSSGTSDSCMPGQEYSCSVVSLSGAGQLSLEFTQNTGLVWSTGMIFFLNASQIPNVQEYYSYSKAGAAVSNLSPGTGYAVTINVTKAGISSNSLLTGEVWAAYQTAGNGTLLYGEIGTISAKAT